MKLWLSKNSEVPMRDQLVTQITLGIASGDLEIGQKLPSRGEISRRFDIHANTVSNAYKKLTEQGLIKFKQGSGFFVAEAKFDSSENENNLDSLTASFLNNAQTLGFSYEEIQDSFQKHLQSNSSNELLLIESDNSLQMILLEEIKQRVSKKIKAISFEDFKKEHKNLDKIFVALSDEEEKLEPILQTEKNCVYLKSRSIPEAMQGENRPTSDSLLAIVSGWETFLQMAKTILIAAKIDPESLIVRSTKEPNWKRGLANASMIICDSLTSKEFPKDQRIRPFYLISDTSIEELKNYIR